MFSLLDERRTDNVPSTAIFPSRCSADPQETSFYVFNRVENGGIRWVSYQGTQEQEFDDPDDELFDIINLGPSSTSPSSSRRR
jgi:hypothetical protein